MRAVDIIAAEIEKNDFTQQKAADICGMTRQRLWDVLDKRNPKFRTMHMIMGAFGYEEVLIWKETGEELSKIETERFVATCLKENVLYDSVVAILGTIGVIVDLKKSNSRKE